ncbi:MAG TPA: cytochrome c, partial [Polyangia bacterium]
MTSLRADVRRFGLWAALIAAGCSPSAPSGGGARAGGNGSGVGGNGSMSTPGSGGITGANGGGTGQPDGGVTPGAGGSTGMPGQLPPEGSGTTVVPSACVDGKAVVLPRAFFTNCSGCHSAFGPSPLPDFPNLFSYQGSAAEFTALVRKGGKTMPPFSAGTISDADLESALAYFKAGKPSDGTCGGNDGP